jgi:hypothetical protein
LSPLLDAQLVRISELIVSHVFPHFILIQPDRVGGSADEFIGIQTLDGRRTLDPLLFPMDEEGHIFFPAPPLLRLLKSAKFSPGLFHAGHLLGLMHVQLGLDRPLNLDHIVLRKDAGAFEQPYFPAD